MDFVGRTDRMAEDLARVVEHINARLDPGGRAMPPVSLLYLVQVAGGAAACRVLQSAPRCVGAVPRVPRVSLDATATARARGDAWRLPAGVEPLVPPPAAAKNVLQRCEAGDSQLLAAHEVEEVTWPGNNKTVLQLKPKEQYCSAGACMAARVGIGWCRLRRTLLPCSGCVHLHACPMAGPGARPARGPCVPAMPSQPDPTLAPPCPAHTADMYFKGQHAHCKASVAAFFGGDLQSFYTTYRGSVASR